MEVALRLAGIGPGDEVITTAITWIATANVVLAVGARPVFVDVDPRTRNLDLAAVEAAITPRTRALLPVYLAGLPVDMDRLYAIAERHRPARDRGRRAGHRLALGAGRRAPGPAHRRLRRPGQLQLPRQQEHHLRRRRLPGAEHAGRGRARRAAAPAGRGAHRHGRHGRGRAGRQVQPHRHQRRASVSDSCPGWPRSPGAGADARAAYFAAAAQAGLEALGIELPPPRSPAAPSPTGTCSRWCCRSTRLPAAAPR